MIMSLTVSKTAVCLAIAILFVFCLGAAPVIGLGPSGVLTATVGTGGFAPSPGYPLHGILSQIAMAPGWADSDRALNLLSALLAGAAVVVFSLAMLELAPRSAFSPSARLLIVGLVATAALLNSPGFALVAYFGDRYTANLFVVSLIAWNTLVFFRKLEMRESRGLQRHVAIAAALASLTLSSHYIMIPLGIFSAGAVAFSYSRAKRKIPAWALFAGGCLGLTPLLYLPLHSLANPVFDWGDPESRTRFLATLTRKEYRHQPFARSWAVFLENWREQYELLYAQFGAVFLVLGSLGLTAVALARKRRLIILLGLLILTGEVTRLAVFFPDGKQSPLYTLHIQELTTKYFAPYYAAVAALAGVGLIFAFDEFERLAARQMKMQVRIGLRALVLIAVAVKGYSGFQETRMDHYRVSDEMIANLEAVTPEGALVFTDFDSLYFPAAYNQMRRGRLEKRTIIHTSLLFRAWYYDGLRKLYPEFYEMHRELFESARQKFDALELGQVALLPEAIEARAQLMRALANLHQGKGVFVFNHPAYGSYQGWVFQGFTLESMGVIERLHSSTHEITPIPVANLKFDQIKSQAVRDSWSWGLLLLYSDLFKQKAGIYRILDKDEAAKLEAAAAEFTL